LQKEKVSKINEYPNSRVEQSSLLFGYDRQDSKLKNLRSGLNEVE